VPQGRLPDTRQSLVDEGVRALLELTPVALVSAVGAKEISRRCGVQVSTLYHHFGSLQKYAEAVTSQVFDPGEFGVAAILDGVSRIHSSGLPVEVSRAMHRSEFARVRDDPELRVRLGLWALGGEGMDRAYGDMLRVVDGRIAASAERMFADWGREISPPFDAQTFVAAHSALLSGSVVRHLVNPEGIDVEKFTRTAQALTMVMLRVIGDRRTLDDRLSEINYYPLHNRNGAPMTDRRSRTKARVLRAAAEHLGREDYRSITIASIARSAGTSPSTVYGLFDGVDDIAVQLLLKQGEDALGQATWTDASGLEQLTERLHWAARFLAARFRYTAPYATKLVTGTTPPGDVLLATIRDALYSARDSGALRQDLDIDRAAPALLLLLMAALLSQAADGPDGAVRHATELILPAMIAA